MVHGNDNKESLLFINFIGENVEIMLDLNSSAVAEVDSNVLNESSPIVVRGYLLDTDDEYYFLGSDGVNITTAIKRKNVIAISLYQEKSMYEELFENLPVPSKKDQN